MQIFRKKQRRVFLKLPPSVFAIKPEICQRVFFEGIEKIYTILVNINNIRNAFMFDCVIYNNRNKSK